VKKRRPYEKEEPINEMKKLMMSNLLDHPQIMSLNILEKMMHSYR